ncbi:MAG: helix-turn-helix domain-containing protein [Crocinitomicaceae bacterium]
MKIYNIPNDLDNKVLATFKVFDHRTSEECVKQMVVLKQNVFSFLIEGSKEVFFDNRSTSIESSDFLLMKAGNCLMSEKQSADTGDYRSVLFFFSKESIFRFIQKYSLKASRKDCLKSVYSFPHDNFIKTFVEGVINIIQLNSKIQEELLGVKFEEIMLYLKETQGVDFIFALTDSVNKRSQHFIDVIEANKLNKLTIKELSFLSNMSVSTFKREFEKRFNCSPSQWFHDKRLEHSAFLLKSKSKRASEIFEEIGYQNLSNFIHAFKAKYGVTPKQYQLN